MLIQNDPDVLFECDECGATISPNSPLMIDNGKHYCCVNCYNVNVLRTNIDKDKLAKEIAKEVYRANPSTFITKD